MDSKTLTRALAKVVLARQQGAPQLPADEQQGRTRGLSQPKGGNKAMSKPWQAFLFLKPARSQTLLARRSEIPELLNRSCGRSLRITFGAICRGTGTRQTRWKLRLAVFSVWRSETNSDERPRNMSTSRRTRTAAVRRKSGEAVMTISKVVLVTTAVMSIIGLSAKGFSFDNCVSDGGANSTEWTEAKRPKHTPPLLFRR